MRSELVPKISAGRFSVSGSASQLAIGPTSSAIGLYSTPAVKVGANRYVSVPRRRARSASTPGIQRAANVHFRSASFSAVPRTARPSPGHTGQAGTRETGSCSAAAASAKATGPRIIAGWYRPDARRAARLIPRSTGADARDDREGRTPTEKRCPSPRVAGQRPLHDRPGRAADRRGRAVAAPNLGEHPPLEPAPRGRSRLQSSQHEARVGAQRATARNRPRSTGLAAIARPGDAEA